MSGSLYFDICALDTSFTTWLIVIGSVHVVLTPCRWIGYSPDGQVARKFYSIFVKCVNALLHIFGIAVSGYAVINATVLWSHDGDQICSGSDTTDTTDNTADCCESTVMYVMLSLFILSGILGCLSCCYPGIVSLMTFK